MERLSRLSLLVAIFICSQWVCSSGTTITSTVCSDNTTCTAANAVCINGTCACNGALKDSNGSTCVAKGLGDPCTAATDCKAVTDAFCHSQDHICSCSGGFKEQTNTCVAKGLGDACTAATDCKAVPNALCHNQDHICSCSGGFKEQTNTCVAKVLGAACSSSNKSTVCKVSNTDCISGHCACLNNSFVDENDECKTAVGKTCTNSTDCPSEANCDKTCNCKNGYVAENGLCHYAVGTTCSKASDCVKNANCDKANKCTCSTGYVDSNGKCSEPKSSADSVKKTITAIVVSFLCAALLNIV